MAGISSALGYYLIGKQSAKGTAATTWFRYRASGKPSIEPLKERDRYEMTDVGRDRGDSYTKVVQVKGSLPMYCHPDGVALPFYLALGANADSGAGPNYTHTITPADDLPWFSVFRVVGGVVTEQFVDCKLDTLKLESKAGEPCMLELELFGITPTWEAIPGSPTVISGDPYKHWEGKDLLRVATVAQRISEIEWSINNNLGPYQADDYFLSDIDPGKREVELKFTMRFTGPTAEPKYREFMYGSDVGTTVPATNLTAKAIDFTFRRDANTEFKVDNPQVRYAAVPVHPDPKGDPIEVEVATEVEKPSGSAVCTVTVKDQNATVG